MVRYFVLHGRNIFTTVTRLGLETMGARAMVSGVQHASHYCVNMKFIHTFRSEGSLCYYIPQVGDVCTIPSGFPFNEVTVKAKSRATVSAHASPTERAFKLHTRRVETMRMRAHKQIS